MFFCCSKIIFDPKCFTFCWDKLDYPGSIVYLSCSLGSFFFSDVNTPRLLNQYYFQWGFQLHIHTLPSKSITSLSHCRRINNFAWCRLRNSLDDTYILFKNFVLLHPICKALPWQSQPSLPLLTSSNYLSQIFEMINMKYELPMVWLLLDNSSYFLWYRSFRLWLI